MMMSALNIRIVRPQTRVSLFGYPWIVAKPYRDLVKTHAVAGEQTGESMAHQVRRELGLADHLQFLVFRVFEERPREIVAVTVCAVFHFRPEHVRLAQSVAFQKSLEPSRKRDGAFLAVLELDCRSPAQVQQARGQIEPPGPRLNDLVLAQTGVKSAVEHKRQVFACAPFNESIALRFRAEVFEPPASEIRGDKIKLRRMKRRAGRL